MIKISLQLLKFEQMHAEINFTAFTLFIFHSLLYIAFEILTHILIFFYLGSNFHILISIT